MSTAAPQRRGRALAVALAWGLVVVVLGFGDVLVGRSLVPGDALARDPVFAAAFPDGPRRGAWDTSGVLVHYPAELEAARQLRLGRLPLWNPRVGLGMPLLAEAHAAPLSPVLWPFVLAPGERAWSLGQLVRPLLMAAGAWLLARRRGAGAPGAALAAVTYALSGLAAARFDLPTEGAAYALLPLVALATWRLADGRSLLPLAALVGVAFLACHPELAAVAIAGGVGLGLGFAHAAHAAGHAAAEGPAAAANGRAVFGRAVVLRAGLALGWGVLAAAIVLLPLVAYVLGDGATYKTDAAQAGRFAGDLRAFPSAPDLLRVGVAPLFAALVALAMPGAAGRSARRLVLVPLAGVVLLFVLQRLLPAPWGALLPPRYALFVASLGLALAAGQGLEQVLVTRPARHLLGLAFATAALWALADLATWGRLHRITDVAAGEAAQALAVAAAVLLGARARARRALPWAIAGTTALTLAVSAHRARAGAGAGIPRTDAARALAREAPARVLGIGPWLDRVPLTPNVAGVLGLADVRAVAAIAPARYRAFFALVDGVRLQPTSTLVERAGSPLLDLLAIDVIVARPEALPPGLVERYRDERVVIARRQVPAARAFAATRLVTAPDATAAADRLATLAATGELPGTVVVEAPLHALAGLGGAARVTITRELADEVELDVDADAPAVIVLADTFADGWRVEVDGRPAEAWPANLLFRATPVPAGRHRVVWRYRPVAAHAGALISAGAWLALAVAVAAVRRRRRPTSGRASA